MSDFTFSYPVPPRDPSWGHFAGVVDPNAPVFTFESFPGPRVTPDTPVLPLPLPPPNPIKVDTVSMGVKAAPKVSKSKRKQKAAAARDPVSDNEVPETTKRRGGRPAGSGNYNDIETKALLKLVEMELPIGMRGWQAVHSRFKKWARDHQRPDREAKSLETKFKQLVRITKPTGSGVRPPNVTEALRISALIDERAETRHLKDLAYHQEEREDEKDETTESSEDDKDDKAPSPKVTARISRVDQACKPSRPTRGLCGPMEVIEQMTQAFDPAVQQACDEQRNNNAIQNTQFLMLSQQLRDSNATNEALRNQIMELTTKALASELKLELSQKPKPTPKFKYRAPRAPHAPSHPHRDRRKRKRTPDSADEESLYVTETDIVDSKENSPSYHRVARYRKLIRPPLLRSPHKRFPSIYCETPVTSPGSLSSSPSLPSPSVAFIRQQKVLPPLRDIVNEPEVALDTGDETAKEAVEIAA